MLTLHVYNACELAIAHLVPSYIEYSFFGHAPTLLITEASYPIHTGIYMGLA
jgi:hypothetical protein